MEIEILEQQCGGTEFVPRPHRLHLGAQNAEGVTGCSSSCPQRGRGAPWRCICAAAMGCSWPPFRWTPTTV